MYIVLFDVMHAAGMSSTEKFASFPSFGPCYAILGKSSVDMQIESAKEHAYYP